MAIQYPKQLINIVASDDSNLTISSCENFYLETSDGSYFKIVTESGTYLSPANFALASGTSLTAYSDQSRDAQLWKFDGRTTDCNDDVLHYAIVNKADETKALQIKDSTVTIATYDKSSSYQKFRLQSYGLEGFASECTNMDGKVKRCTIGGLLGKTVYVDNITDLLAESKDDTAKTIVISSSIDVPVDESYAFLDSDESLLTKVVCGKNKTIIGAYGTYLNNVWFYLDKYSDGGNFILKNVEIRHDEDYRMNNFIPLYISVGINFWIDHCTFVGHDSYADCRTAHTLYESENHPVDKFIYVGVLADYVSLTHCKLGNHEYGLILGYPNESSETVINTYTGYPRMTIAKNFFQQMYCRAPGLMRYGYYHVANNYVESVHLGFTLYTNATVHSELNYFNDVTAVLDDKTCKGFVDENSYPAVTAKNSPTTTWRASDNYDMETMATSEICEFAETYCGVASKASMFKY